MWGVSCLHGLSYPPVGCCVPCGTAYLFRASHKRTAALNSPSRACVHGYSRRRCYRPPFIVVATLKDWPHPASTPAALSVMLLALLRVNVAEVYVSVVAAHAVLA